MTVTPGQTPDTPTGDEMTPHRHVIRYETQPDGTVVPVLGPECRECGR